MDLVFAYLAGLIDGEGCISIRGCRQGKFVYYKPMIEVGMTDRQPIELLEKTFGNSAWYEVIPTGRRKLICHKWRVTGTHCMPIINALLPYIIVKRKQASLVIELAKRLFPRGKNFTPQERAREYRVRTILYKKMKVINNPYLIASNA